MKQRFLILICLLSLVILSQVSPAAETVPDKTPAVEASPELTVPEKDCQALTEYQPSADVAYQPGVDVHGKPVMEADITPSVIKPPEKISFDLTVDLAKYMGLTTPAGVLGYAKMGTITIEKGQATFNGTPLEGDAAATLKAVCAAQTAKAAAAKNSAPPK